MSQIEIKDDQGKVVYRLVIDNEEPAWAYHTLVANADYERIQWHDVED